MKTPIGIEVMTKIRCQIRDRREMSKAVTLKSLLTSEDIGAITIIFVKALQL